jgi:hypothetical protein
MISKNLLPTYRRQPNPFKPIQPLRPIQPLHALPPAPNFVRQPSGQRTLPIAGAPLLPQNPFLKVMRMMQRNRK